MKANEMIAASNQVRPVLVEAIRSHMDELTRDLLQQLETEVTSLKKDFDDHTRQLDCAQEHTNVGKVMQASWDYGQRDIRLREPRH